MELEGLQISSDRCCGQPSAGHGSPFILQTWTPGMKGSWLGLTQVRATAGHLPKFPAMLLCWD